jgi:hypothetical protein
MRREGSAVALVNLKFRLLPGEVTLGETRMASVVPTVGDTVFLQSEFRQGGRVRYQVVGIEHYYTDNLARTADQYTTGPIWVNLMESK